MITRTHVRSQAGDAPDVRSRASIWQASLPSTSPAWMLAMTRILRSPWRSAAAGVKAFVGETMAHAMSRPSALSPIDSSRTRSDWAARARRNSSTSAWVEVSRACVRSAFVRRPGGFIGRGLWGGSAEASRPGDPDGFARVLGGMAPCREVEGDVEDDHGRDGGEHELVEEDALPERLGVFHHFPRP